MNARRQFGDHTAVFLMDLLREDNIGQNLAAVFNDSGRRFIAGGLDS
jgi:hypothetical protein